MDRKGDAFVARGVVKFGGTRKGRSVECGVPGQRSNLPFVQILVCPPLVRLSAKSDRCMDGTRKSCAITLVKAVHM